MKDVRQLNVQNFVDCVEPFVSGFGDAKRLKSVRLPVEMTSFYDSDIARWRKKLREHWKVIEWSKFVEFEF